MRSGLPPIDTDAAASDSVFKMRESDAQLDRRRNREQWYALIRHLLEHGYTIADLGGVYTLHSPEGQPLMNLPDGFPSQQGAA